MVANHSGDVHQYRLSDFDNIILAVFEEIEDVFSFPVASQKDARAFVRAVHGRGVSYETLSEEIGEHLQILTSWRKTLGRQGIGEKVMQRINKPLNDLLDQADYVWDKVNPENIMPQNNPKNFEAHNGENGHDHANIRVEINHNSKTMKTNGVIDKQTNYFEKQCPKQVEKKPVKNENHVQGIVEIPTKENQTVESFISDLTTTIINEVTGKTSSINSRGSGSEDEEVREHVERKMVTIIIIVM